jgi:uncharacterized membrane protein YdbT with pleckstrin-like domain
MSTVHYNAYPSLIRMRPVGTLLAAAVMLFGIALVGLGKALLPVGLPPGIGDEAVQIVGVVLFALAGLQLFVWYISTRTDHLIVNDDELVWTHGIFGRQYIEIGMSSVSTVRVEQSFLQRMMGAGDVTIFTAGDTPELKICGLPDPGVIRDLVKGKSPAAA